jgi:phosphoglycolate phosphatase
MDQGTAAAGKPRAVLFDFDGTLADSYDAITASVNHVRSTHGLPPLTQVEVRPHVGRGLEKLLERVVPGTDQDRNLALYRAHHVTVMRQHTRLLPGVRDVLTRLKRSGLLIGVCSNKKVAFTRDLLDFLGLAPFIDTVVGPEDVARQKPAPDMLLAGLDRLGVTPAEALYVGDMTVDVEAARAAGVPVWTVATGSHERATLAAARPDRVLENLTAVAEHLERASGRSPRSQS